MRGLQQPDAPEKRLPEGEMSMKEMWAEAARSFESICGESLQRGEVRSFEDVRAKIEISSKPGVDDGPGDRWEKAKSAGLESLKYLKLLVGAACQASEFIPLPASAVHITSNALFFVFDIPGAIKGYNDAIDQVFSEVSSALSQFKIYESINNIDPLLIRQIHLVIVSFVKICAHVITYRQGRKRDRIFQQVKSIFNDDSGLADSMAEFKRALQQQRDVEGTITLSLVVETRADLKTMLENLIVFAKTTEETRQVVQETQKGVQSLSAEAARIKTLIKIRNTLNVPSTVRLDTKTTRTCSDIHRKCLDGTGSWIWTHPAYTAWKESKDKTTSHVLVISGPSSSGKTLASSLITKRLEEQKGRTYVAHYFFPASAKKSDDEKNPVQVALKYMAFQIARVDQIVLAALGKACDANASAFRSSASLEDIWAELKIGTPGSGAWYYLVFDGLENLPERQAEMLLKFLFGPKIAGDVTGRVRFLVSGTDDEFANDPAVRSALQIQMGKHNMEDMRIIIDDALTSQGMLKNTRSGSAQEKAKVKIVEKLPQNVKGSYSLLQFGLDEVIRLLSTRTAVEELDRVLDQMTSSHEVAIKKLQRSLTADEISELNELLKWVLFSKIVMNLDQLEAAMFLYSGTESLASLRYIIKEKYSAVLKLEDTYVYEQDGVKDYLYEEKDNLDKSSQSKERATISMTITINNVDQELCGHFLWDLAHKAIRDKFRFDFDTASTSLHSNKVAIAVDEFEAHRTIVTRGFDYLSKEPRDQTTDIGEYLVCWLPYHLSRLFQLDEEEKGALMPDEQVEIGRNLFDIFKDEKCFRRHKASFERTIWTADEMEEVQKWLTDSAVVRKLDKRWRNEVRRAPSLTVGFLKEFVKMVVTGFLRERTWDVENACSWIREFMRVIDWDRLSTWCQGFLGLPESELNSLWYERLATAASSQNVTSDAVLPLFERAIEREHPSWLCQSGLGEAYFAHGRTLHAIAQIELALTNAQLEGATPKPEEKDMVRLHLLLGEYAYAADDVQKAADQYLLACGSSDAEQARQGQLGNLKSRLRFSNIEETRKMLRDSLVLEGEESKMVGVLKMVARDADHEAIVLKMVFLAEGDPDLLAGIVRAMETATITTHTEDRTAEMSSEDRFAEDEYRGVLLYYRGVAAYIYKVSSKGTEPVSEALRLWKESRDQLSNVGGPNAFWVRQKAATALAKHYFQSMMDEQSLVHLDELSKLAEDSPEFFVNNSSGFLGALHALRGRKEKSREVLGRRMRQGLQILLDDTPDNDRLGFSIIHRTLHQHQDLVNAAIALSLLGLPDLVTKELYFELKDINDEDGIDKQQVLETVTRLAKETIQAVKIRVADASHQLRRIEAAKAHVDSLMTATKSESNFAVDDNNDGTTEKSKGQGHSEDMSTRVDLYTTTALRLLHTRITALHRQTLIPGISPLDIEDDWLCDGRDVTGNECKNQPGFEHEFYHCIYCIIQDFCGDCLKRLRDPKSEVKILGCSSNHKWLRIPPSGTDMYAGVTARSVRVPREVKASEEDENILNIHYTEGETEEVTVAAWLERLATEWDIPLTEIRKEMAGRVMFDSNDDGV
ncbi:hypothetical protein F4803DRAFT_560482 [Xylaria telfairii]|nr:hypothetical protein F4803DRAFT_560482 [Xylaria telfairii]